MTLWAGQGLSEIGAQLAQLAIPVVAILLLDASEFQVGVLNASAVAAFLIIGLPAGAWIDRMHKRKVMIWADVLRALSLGVIPLLWAFDVLHMWHLFAIALVIGIATVFFDVSYQSVIPVLVPCHAIASANAKLEGTLQVARLAGPAIGGSLISVVGAPTAIGFTVISYLGSVIALLMIHDKEPKIVRPRTSLTSDIAEGLRWVWHTPLLRMIVIPVAVSGLFANVVSTLLPIVILRNLGMSTARMGLIMSLGAVGGLLAALCVRWNQRLFGQGPLFPLSAAIWAGSSFLVPLALVFPRAGFVLLIIQGFTTSFGIVTFNILNVSLRQQITPQPLLGRMNATVRFLFWGVLPIGALLAGTAADLIGTTLTLFLAAAAELACLLPLIFGPLWRQRVLPHSPDELQLPQYATLQHSLAK